MFKKIVFLLFLFFPSVLSAYCQREASIYINNSSYKGFIEIYYIDIYGNQIKDYVDENERKTFYVDTDYEVIVAAIPDREYQISDWGNNDFYDSNTLNFFVCEDIFLYPHFEKDYYNYPYYHEEEESCFIKSLGD